MIRSFVAAAFLLSALTAVIGAVRVVSEPWLPDATPHPSLRREVLPPPDLTESPAEEISVQSPAAPLPASHQLEVPFILQAPYSVWDPLHEETCEEASLLMVWHFGRGDKAVDKATAEREIKELVAYEEAAGFGVSITLTELAEIAAVKLQLADGQVSELNSLDDIKRAIANGQPVIVGAAGKLLQNPYFRNGGPIYHMLVITGYSPDVFIANDPGIGRGHGYRYSPGVLEGAIHDWNKGGEITQGPRRFLTFPPR